MKQILLLFILLSSPAFTFAQCLDGDCQNGSGKFKFKNGNYVGSFLNGEINGKGLFSTRRGYCYDGAWVNGVKSGFGEETMKKTIVYTGDFENNFRHGKGLAVLEDNKYMERVTYDGQWQQGVMCGDGELTFFREIKYGKQKLLEKNSLIGTFINGVYQGRQTSVYDDELSWESFGLKMEHFQKYESLSERDQKRVKNPATIEGSIALSCECIANTLIFNASSILRKDLSWWSTNIIAADTKPIVLSMKQGEFDIIEWHARELEFNLNKQKMQCNTESILIAWSELALLEREAIQVRKSYSSETAWNPKKGTLKNPVVQEKWNKKILKKLNRYDKLNAKLLSKFKKKTSKIGAEPVLGQCQPMVADNYTIPIKKELVEKENVTVNKEDSNKPRRSFRPQFPRKQQLE